MNRIGSACLLLHFSCTLVLANSFEIRRSITPAEQEYNFFPELIEFEKNLPKVLYTWLEPEELQPLINKFQNLPGGTELTSATRTPLSSFMYGSILVRIKLRPAPYNVFQIKDEFFDRVNTHFSKTNRPEDGIMSYLGLIPPLNYSMREYLFPKFNPTTIESISYSTPEILSEMVFERRLLEDVFLNHVDLALRT